MSEGSVTALVKQLDSIVAPWERAGVSAEEYLTSLRDDLAHVRDSFQGVVQYRGGVGEALLPIARAVNLAAYVATKREAQGLRAFAQRMRMMNEV